MRFGHRQKLIIAVFIFLIVLLYLRLHVPYTNKFEVTNREIFCSLMTALESGAQEVTSTKIYVKESKDPSDGFAQPVTTADTNSNNQILSTLEYLLGPKIKIISEENKTDKVKPRFPPQDCSIFNFPKEKYLLDDIQLWIDPLDATQEFTEGGDVLTSVSVMGCVVHKGSPIVGIMINPFEVSSRRFYWGYIGKEGGKSNVALSKVGKIGRVIMSRSHNAESEGDSEDVFKKIGVDVTVRKAGGSGFKTLSVLRGESDLYVHKSTIKKWDLCAPDAVARASGTGVVDFDLNPVDYADYGTVEHKSGVLVSAWEGDVAEIGRVLRPA